MKNDVSNSADARFDDDSKLVYVKPIALDELPDEVREKVNGQGPLFAVHNDAGQQLALVAGRRLAFELARENDLQPVTVH
jgi:hypothetical protein